jgi:hypothetical protein
LQERDDLRDEQMELREFFDREFVQRAGLAQVPASP